MANDLRVGYVRVAFAERKIIDRIQQICFPIPLFPPKKQLIFGENERSACAIFLKLIMDNRDKIIRIYV